MVSMLMAVLNDNKDPTIVQLMHIGQLNAMIYCNPVEIKKKHYFSNCQTSIVSIPMLTDGFLIL